MSTHPTDELFGDEAQKADKVSNGRYQLPDPYTGKPGGFTRATTIAGTVDDKYLLHLWQRRMMLKGIVARPDLLALAASTPLDERDALNRVADAALVAANVDAGANFGTALHSFTETLDRGGDLNTIPDQFRGDVDAYREVLAENGIEVLEDYIEVTCLNEDFDVAGTFDRIYRLPDGSLVIGDLKTQKSMDFSSGPQGIQLSLYSRARQWYDYATRQYRDMPPVRQDLGLIVHLPVGSGKATLHWVNLNLGYHGAALAMQVRQYRSMKGIVYPFSPGVIPAPKMRPQQIDENRNNVAPVGESRLGWTAAAHASTFISPAPTDAAEFADVAATDDQVIEKLASQSKSFLQSAIRKLNPHANVSKYRKDLAVALVSLRRSSGLDPATGEPLTATDVDETTEAPRADNAAETIAAASQPWPPDPAPSGGRAAVLDGMPEPVTAEQEEASEDNIPPNPFAAPVDNPFAPATPDPAAQLADRMRAATSKAELAKVWEDAVAAGLHTPELMAIGGERVKVLQASNQA